MIKVLFRLISALLLVAVAMLIAMDKGALQHLTPPAWAQSTPDYVSAKDFTLASANGQQDPTASVYVSAKDFALASANGQQSSQASVHVSAKDFALAADNGDPAGITWDGTYYRVVDWRDDKVYTYNATGDHISSQDFTLTSANVDSTGITWDGTYYWVTIRNNLGGVGGHAYAYNSSGNYVSSRMFSFDSENVSPYGITWDGSYLRNVDFVDLLVYAYTSSGTYTSSLNFGLGVDPSTNYSDPFDGITWDGLYYCLVRQKEDRIYIYSSTGARVATRDVVLPTVPGSNTGLTWDGTYYRMVNSTSDSVFTYLPNPNNAPVFPASITRKVPHTYAPKTNVGSPVTATDPNGDAITYALGGTNASLFTISTSSGQLTVAVGASFATGATYSVTVTAEDSLGSTSVANVSITYDNANPVFPSNITRSVLETVLAGTNVGLPVSATDADNDTLTYALGGTDASTFRLDTSTAQLTVAPGMTLEQGVLAVTVTATDGHGGSATAAVRITVGDSGDASLSELSLDHGVLSPVFSPVIYSYSTSVVSSVDVVVVTATPAQPTDVTVLGAGENKLDPGENEINIQVTASDGTTQLTYQISVYRGRGTDFTADIPTPTMHAGSQMVQDALVAGLDTIGMKPYATTGADGEVVIVDPRQERAEMAGYMIAGMAAAIAFAVLMVTTGNIGLAAAIAVMIWSGIMPILFQFHPAVAYGPVLLLLFLAAMVLIGKFSR